MKTFDFRMGIDGDKTIIQLTGLSVEQQRAVYKILCSCIGFDADAINSEPFSPNPSVEYVSAEVVGVIQDNPDETSSRPVTDEPMPETNIPLPPTTPSATVVVDGLAPLPPAPVLPTEADIAKTEDYSVTYRRGKALSEGRFKGKTPTEVLTSEKDAGLVYLYYYVKKIPTCDERSEAVACAKQYMYTMPNRRDNYPDRDSRLTFISTMSKIGDISPFINGYRSFDDFATNASNDEVYTAFYALTQSMQERGVQENSAIEK